MAPTDSPVLCIPLPLLAIQCVNELVVIAAVTTAAEYSVLESAGFVLLNISVLNGSVGTNIVLDLSTML